MHIHSMGKILILYIYIHTHTHTCTSIIFVKG